MTTSTQHQKESHTIGKIGSPQHPQHHHVWAPLRWTSTSRQTVKAVVLDVWVCQKHIVF